MKKAICLIIALGSLVLAGVAQAATIEGTNGNDTLNGTVHGELIVGKGGNDLITGYGGADVVRAGGGSDTIKVYNPVVDGGKDDGLDAVRCGRDEKWDYVIAGLHDWVSKSCDLVVRKK